MQRNNLTDPPYTFHKILLHFNSFSDGYYSYLIRNMVKLFPSVLDGSEEEESFLINVLNPTYRLYNVKEYRTYFTISAAVSRDCYLLGIGSSSLSILS